MKKLIFLLGMLAANSAMADALGVRISGGVFDYQVSGTLKDGPDEIDVKSTLGFEDDSDSHAYVYIEHPVPILPNFRLGTTSLKLAGTGNTGGGFTFNGQVFPAGQSITSSFDMSHTEVALYYEIIDVGFDLDLGINVKLFDGEVSLATVGVSASDKYDGAIPMLYGAVNIPLPLNFSIAGDISFLSTGDSEFTDYFVRLRYQTDFALGVELGYRSISLDYEDTGANELAKIDADGPYLNLNLFF
jgi:outer membrane protein